MKLKITKTPVVTPALCKACSGSGYYDSSKRNKPIVCSACKGTKLEIH